MITKQQVRAELEKLGLTGESFKMADVKKILAKLKIEAATPAHAVPKGEYWLIESNSSISVLSDTTYKEIPMITKQQVKAELEKLGLTGDSFKMADVKKILASFKIGASQIQDATNDIKKLFSKYNGKIIKEFKDPNKGTFHITTSLPDSDSYLNVRNYLENHYGFFFYIKTGEDVYRHQYKDGLLVVHVITSNKPAVATTPAQKDLKDSVKQLDTIRMQIQDKATKFADEAFKIWTSHGDVGNIYLKLNDKKTWLEHEWSHDNSKYGTVIETFKPNMTKEMIRYKIIEILNKSSILDEKGNVVESRKSTAKWESSEQGYALSDSTGELGSVLESTPGRWFAYDNEEEPLNRRPFDTKEEAMALLEEKIGITGDKSIVTAGDHGTDMHIRLLNDIDYIMTPKKIEQLTGITGNDTENFKSKLKQYVIDNKLKGTWKEAFEKFEKAWTSKAKMTKAETEVHSERSAVDQFIRTIYNLSLCTSSNARVLDDLFSSKLINLTSTEEEAILRLVNGMNNRNRGH